MKLNHICNNIMLNFLKVGDLTTSIHNETTTFLITAIENKNIHYTAYSAFGNLICKAHTKCYDYEQNHMYKIENEDLKTLIEK